MKNKLNIFYVAPEVAPFAKTNDLAEVTAALPKFLKSQGHDIRVMMPKYRIVNERKYVLRDVIRLQSLKIKLGNETLEANGKSAFIPNSKVQIYFLDHKDFFDRPGLYGDPDSNSLYDDNAKRFLFFALGCLETLKLLYWQPDIIHCNNWQTALIPLLLKTLYKNDPFFANSRTLLSVHSTSEQGMFENSLADLIELPEALLKADEILSKENVFSFLHAGLEYADGLNLMNESNVTNSIHGIEQNSFSETLKKKIGSFPNINLGIDGQEWNPETDKLIVSNYTKDKLSGKLENKKELCSKFGLTADESSPLVSVVFDYNSDKDDDFLLPAIEELAKSGLTILVASAYRHYLHDGLQALQKKYPQKIGVNFKADSRLAHLIEAGSDISLRPSAREGTSLGQLCSLAYGTVPVVKKGESPSMFIKQFDPKTRCGTGFFYDKADATLLVAAVKKAVSFFKDKSTWQRVVQNAMEEDVFLQAPALQYVRLYQKMLSGRTVKK